MSIWSDFRRISLCAFVMVALPAGGATRISAAELPLVDTVEAQPLASATERLLQTLEFVGSPLKKDDSDKLREVLMDRFKSRHGAGPKNPRPALSGDGHGQSGKPRLGHRRADPEGTDSTGLADVSRQGPQ